MRTPLVVREIREEDFPSERSWELLEWCLSHGVDAFSITPMSIGRRPAPTGDALVAELEPYSLDRRLRQVITLPSADRASGGAPVWKVWKATRTSVATLRRYLGASLFSCELDIDRGWLENPVFWRGDDFILAIISHESEGALCLTAREHTAVLAAGFVTRASEGRDAW
jgi:hypothetical protein